MLTVPLIGLCSNVNYDSFNRVQPFIPIDTTERSNRSVRLVEIELEFYLEFSPPPFAFLRKTWSLIFLEKG